MSAKFDEEAHNGLVYPVHKLISIYIHCDLQLWPVTSKINRVYSLTMVNMSAKFDDQLLNGLVFIVFTWLFPCQLWLTSKINRVHPLTIANTPAKFDKDTTV